MRIRRITHPFWLLIGLSAAGFCQGAGTIDRIVVHGTSLEGNLERDSADRDVSVYLPPSYMANPDRRFPVVYMLHGYTDSDERWFGLTGRHFINLPEALDRATDNGSLETIVVMPNAYTKYAGSMYSNSAATGDWEAFVADDLVAYVDSHYRTIDNKMSRGLAGHSMGGYGTIRIGMKYSNVFSSLYSLSPCCMAANMSPSVEAMEQAALIESDEQFAAAEFGVKAMMASAAAWSPNPTKDGHPFDLPVHDGKIVPEIVARWAANAPLAMLHQYVPQLRTYEAIAVDAGDRDVGIAETVRVLDRALDDYGIDHQFEIYEGDHVNRIDERISTHVMPFFSRHLKTTR